MTKIHMPAPGVFLAGRWKAQCGRFFYALFAIFGKRVTCKDCLRLLGGKDVIAYVGLSPDEIVKRNAGKDKYSINLVVYGQISAHSPGLEAEAEKYRAKPREDESV